jgi:alkyl hydroperoxide reductase subunit AhpC
VSELPSVQRAHDELKKDGVQVITISIDGTGEAAVKPIFAKGGYTMPALLDQDMNVARGFGVRGVPSTVIVDKKGLIHARGLGHVDFDGKVLRDYARNLARAK